MALNLKQKLFIRYYALYRNATRAAAKAGYSKKTAGVQGHDLLKKPEIWQAINDRIERIAEKSELKSSDVLDELKRLAFVDLSLAYNPDGTLKHPINMPRDIRAALNMVETDEIMVGRGATRRKIGETKKIKLSDKVRALEMLAKHFKLLTDVHEHGVKDGSGPIVVLTMPANGTEAVAPKDPEPQGDDSDEPSQSN